MPRVFFAKLLHSRYKSLCATQPCGTEGHCENYIYNDNDIIIIVPTFLIFSWLQIVGELVGAKMDTLKSQEVSMNVKLNRL